MLMPVFLLHCSPATLWPSGQRFPAKDLPLLTPDALNIAIAQRVGAEILTFDKKMAVSARVLGSTVLVA
jgi:hypothetical protein